MDVLNVSSESLRADFEAGIKGKSYAESVEINKLVEKVLEKEKLDIAPAELGCIIVYPNLSKTRIAKMKKASAIEEFYSGNNYILQISGETWDMLDDETRYILIYHELLKIDTQYKEKSGEWKFKLRPTDYNDFYTINEDFGSTWYKTIQSTASSLYDLDPRQESKVKT